MAKHKIVVIGAGFGGVYTCLNLLKQQKKYKKEIEITLIDKNNYFLFTPLLHEVASGNLTPEQVITPIRNLLQPCVHFVKDEVTKIDTKSSNVLTKDGKYYYDYCVISTGSKTIINPSDNNFTLKTLDDAVNIKNHIIDVFEGINNKDKKFSINNLSFTVIGAGATGVELISELSEYFDTICKYYPNINRNDISLTLISSHDTLINNFPKYSQEIAIKHLEKSKINIIYNKKVHKYDNNKLIFKDGSSIKSNFNYWTVGVTPNSNIFSKTLNTNENKKIIVNKCLQTNHKNIFALGDVISEYEDNAQIAVLQSKFIAKNIYNLLLKSELIPFKNREMGQLISLGKMNATGKIFIFNIKGMTAWFIWRTVYLTKMITWRKRIAVAVNWTLNLFSDRDISKF